MSELKQKIKDVKDSVNDSESNSKKQLQPMISNILSMLMERENQQLQTNKKLQNDIIKLKKEKAELVQNIIQCKKKVDELQKDLGRYPGDKNVRTGLETYKTR